MSLTESVAAKIGEDVLKTAKELGWNDDVGRTESAFQYVMRMQHEKGVQESAVAEITELGKYKRTVTLQRRLVQMKDDRIRILEAELASLQGGEAAVKFVRQGGGSPLNSSEQLSYRIKVQAPCRAEQVDSQMVCKCGNIWNPYSEFWPACRRQANAT